MAGRVWFMWTAWIIGKTAYAENDGSWWAVGACSTAWLLGLVAYINSFWKKALS